MESAITKRTNRNGVDIRVVIHKKKFDVYIGINPEADVSKKFQCEQFTLRFRLASGKGSVDQVIHLKKKNLKYTAGSANQNVRLRFNSEEYKCEISLAPEVYVPDEMIAEAKKKQAEKTQKNDQKPKIKIGDGYRPGMSSAKMTTYSHSNIARPYFGGRCSSK